MYILVTVCVGVRLSIIMHSAEAVHTYFHLRLRFCTSIAIYIIIIDLYIHKINIISQWISVLSEV